MPWQMKVYLILFAAWFGAASADRYKQGGITDVIFGVVLPAMLGAVLGFLAVNWELFKQFFKIHIIGGIKFLWCKIFHGKASLERTGRRAIVDQSICYELRCTKCGCTDDEWVTPEWYI